MANKNDTGYKPEHFLVTTAKGFGILAFVAAYMYGAHKLYKHLSKDRDNTTDANKSTPTEGQKTDSSKPGSMQAISFFAALFFAVFTFLFPQVYNLGAETRYLVPVSLIIIAIAIAVRKPF